MKKLTRGARHRKPPMGGFGRFWEVSGGFGRFWEVLAKISKKWLKMFHNHPESLQTTFEWLSDDFEHYGSTFYQICTYSY